MKIIGLSGWSGSGKTTLLTMLIPELNRRGIAVSTIKHAHHDFDIDQPGKDSYEHRAAGAREVLVASSRRWALMHELHGEEEPSLETLIGKITPVDLLLVEGFKHSDHQKIEIWRQSNGKPLRAPGDASIIAVACDVPPEEVPLSVPLLDLDDVAAIADFIQDHLKL